MSIPGFSTPPRRLTHRQQTAPQHRFLTHNARFRAFVGGVGSGKTRAGCLAILSMPARSVGTVLAPTYPMLRDATLRTFLELAQSYRPSLLSRFNRSEMIAVLTDGKVVLFRSADDPDRLRGPNLGWFYLDEAALMPHDVWRIMLGRLRDAPARAWVTSTPRGFNWLHEVFAQGGPDYALIHSSTRDNPFLPRHFVASLEQSYTTDWQRQEIEGEFVAPSGVLFERQWFAVVDRAPEGLRWVRYWDLAASTKTSADYTASAAVAFAGDGTLYIRDMVRGKWEWPDAKLILIQTMLAELGVEHGIEEALHGLAAVQELHREPRLINVALRGIHVDRDKLSRAMPWAARANQGKVALVRGGWVGAFLDEVCLFNGSGVAHDDQVDTVSGGVQMLGSVLDGKLFY